MVSTDLTTRGSNQIVPAGAGRSNIEGMEDMGQEDFILPNYSMVQPISRGDKGKAPVGHFWNNLSGEATAVLVAVVLKLSPCRTLWKSTEERIVECSSYNGVHGRDGKLCAGCEWNKWAEDKNEKTCRKGYLMVCADTQSDDSVFIIRASGKSVKAAKILASQFRDKRKPIFSFHVKFEGVLTEDDTGKYCILRPSIIGELAPEQVGHYRELFQFLQGVSIADTEGAENVESEASASVSGGDELPF